MDSERWNITPPPPPLEEGYWEALLKEGEHAAPVYRNQHHGNGYHYNGNHHPHDEEAALYNAAPPPDPAAVAANWQRIHAIMDADETVTLKVVGYNRGGLLVEWDNLRGFVPASQLLYFPTNGSPTARRDALVQQVGKSLVLRIIELNPEQNRLVLSERAAQVAPGERADILHKLKHGDIISGKVTNITDFGVFIDLGGLEGLIHISELSWGRVRHPSDICKRGEDLNVYVLDTQKDAGRIALSIKRLRPDPWQTVETRYHIGQIVEGKITNVVDFGAFACIEDGLEGLIHVSELAEGHFLHPRNVVIEQQHVRVCILSIDRQSRRLGLSLRLTQSS